MLLMNNSQTFCVFLELYTFCYPPWYYSGMETCNYQGVGLNGFMIEQLAFFSLFLLFFVVIFSYLQLTVCGGRCSLDFKLSE